MEKNITSYTQDEFLSLVRRISIDDYPTEQEHIDAVLLFEKLTEHPDGSDLFYYPDDPADATPERIVEIVKQWRMSQGLPCFKD
ncbi:bacteriocin immunity protein [Vibrio sp. MEBiC08052]|uniref:bacteriocin immunity protein n=1 Tax=Vibrio sp. MEBiC08052 TaxID=1761910 RepID=UPI0007405ED2|nr:bacteriocin immunity protein [Vibrio sp. MEBiC08052]KUI97529.1 pyocin S2 immunity protein [Vibrio sp. MEBiC08052]